MGRRILVIMEYSGECGNLLLGLGEITIILPPPSGANAVWNCGIWRITVINEYNPYGRLSESDGRPVVWFITLGALDIRSRWPLETKVSALLRTKCYV